MLGQGHIAALIPHYRHAPELLSMNGCSECKALKTTYFLKCTALSLLQCGVQQSLFSITDLIELGRKTHEL